MPRLIPVMLVHGFDGAPSNWTDSGFRQALILGGDLDPNLVRSFDYGIASDGTYNNRGDLRQVAARLAGAGLAAEDRLLCSVDQLSDNSVARGGPAGVTLIAHSLGGIICRYYLSRTASDEWGTHYRGNVGRLITIGSPHQGVDLVRLTDLAPRGSPVWWFIRLLEKLGLAPARPAAAIEKLEAELQGKELREREAPQVPGPRVLLTDSPIYHQLHPDSELLAELNTPGMAPDRVACHTLFGDIRFRFHIRAGRIILVDRTVSFGDLVVSADSARDIPNVACHSYPFVDENEIGLSLTRQPDAAALRSLPEVLPEVAHGRQLSNPEIQKTVLSILAP